MDMFSFLLGKCLRMELMDQKVNKCTFNKTTAQLFSDMTVPLYIPTSSILKYKFLLHHILLNNLWSLFLRVYSGLFILFQFLKQ